MAAPCLIRPSWSIVSGRRGVDCSMRSRQNGHEACVSAASRLKSKVGTGMRSTVLRRWLV